MAGLGLRGLAALALVLALCAKAGADETKANEIRFSSEKMEKSGAVYTLTGGALVEFEKASVSAPTIMYDEETGDAYAEGGVFYEDPAITLKAERAELNLKDQTGVLYEAEMYVKADGFLITGSEIRRTGPDSYVLKRASATTCEGASPDWCLRGSEVDILLGERLKARHATFRVKGVPVFYTPYIWAPIIDERRSGLLPPTLGYRDSTGFLYRQPLFWAISGQRDATLHLDYYTKRSFGQGLEYRYVEAPGVNGNTNLYHIRDSRIDRDYYEARALHRHSSGRARGYADIALVNYREFYRRFEPYLEGSSQRYLESRAEASALLHGARPYVLAEYFQDLADGVDKDTLTHKLPEGGVFVLPFRAGPLVFHGRAGAAEFESAGGPEGERYGASIVGTHSAGRGVTLTQSFGAGHLAYVLDDGEEDTLGLSRYDYTAALQARLARDFGGTVHEVTPALSYGYVSRDGEEPPLFDSEELFSERSVSELSLLNRLSDEAGEFLTFKAAQPYDFRGGERPFLPLRLDFALMRPFELRTSISYDVHLGHVVTSDTDVVFRFPRTRFSAGHRYSMDSGVTLYTAEGDFEATDALSLNGRIWYDSEGGGLRELAAGIDFRNKCWGVEVSGVKRPEDYGVFFNIRLLGLGGLEV